MNETNQTDRFAPLFAELDRRLAGEPPVRLAIEGGSASGKTTLGQILAGRYGCTVFHMDDFFLRPEQRTPARFAEPGGNVVRLRFHAAAKRRGDRAGKARCDRGSILHAPGACAVLRSFRFSGHLPGIAARAHFAPQYAGEGGAVFPPLDPDGAGVFFRVRYPGAVHAALSHSMRKEKNRHD